MLIISRVRVIPPELEHLITIIPAHRPTQEAIELDLRNYAEAQNFKISEKDVGSLSLDLIGLSAFQISQIFNTAYCNGGYISSRKDKQLIFSEKQQTIEKSGLLEFVERDTKIDEVGGMPFLKRWLENKARIFTGLNEALKAGLDRPKGALILGVPGCGKSLIAKTTASLFEVPLVRLDIGRLLGKYVGESESKMRSALLLAESISPCILWIDEIEKAFAGSSGDGHEVTRRLIGQFLTWMQEKASTVFVIATANNIESLPPEFLRKGRFDEIFSVGLPNERERSEIFRIHLNRRKCNVECINFKTLSKEAEKFSGADIEYAVSCAVESVYFSESKIVTTNALVEAIKKTHPLAKSLEKKFLVIESKLKEYKITSASDGSVYGSSG